MFTMDRRIGSFFGFLCFGKEYITTPYYNMECFCSFDI